MQTAKGIGDNGIWRIAKLNGILYLLDVGSNDPQRPFKGAAQLPKLKWPKAHNLSVLQLVCGSHKLEGRGD